MARPKKATEQQRQHVIAYRVNDKELESLEAAAKQAGMSNVNSFARHQALSRRVTVSQQMTFPFDVARELRAIGVNINQQTRRLHETGHVPPELRTLWAKLDGLLTWVIDHGPARRQGRQ